jgi:hypothetical protein
MYYNYKESINHDNSIGYPILSILYDFVKHNKGLISLALMKEKRAIIQKGLKM